VSEKDEELAFWSHMATILSSKEKREMFLEKLAEMVRNND
jgi:hypothetical protein